MEDVGECLDRARSFLVRALPAVRQRAYRLAVIGFSPAENDLAQAQAAIERALEAIECAREQERGP